MLLFARENGVLDIRLHYLILKFIQDSRRDFYQEFKRLEIPDKIVQYVFNIKL